MINKEETQTSSTESVEEVKKFNNRMDEIQQSLTITRYWLRGALILPVIFFVFSVIIIWWTLLTFELTRSGLGNSAPYWMEKTTMIIFDLPAVANDYVYYLSGKTNLLYINDYPTKLGFVFLIFFYFTLTSVAGGLIGFIFGKIKKSKL